MGTRSSGSISITLGPINFTLSLYSVASSKSTSFARLHTPTKNKLKQKTFDAVTNEEAKEFTKAYEISKDTYVYLTEEEISSIEGDKVDTLDIVEFIHFNQINHLHIEKSYYTTPDAGMDRYYQLLYQTLLDTNRAAVGTLIFDTKERLVIIAPYQHGLIAHQMYYNSEINSFDDKSAKPELTDKEIELMKNIINGLSVEELSKTYSDKFVTKLQAAIKIKLAGKEITSKAVEKAKDNLESSLVKNRKKKAC